MTENQDVGDTPDDIHGECAELYEEIICTRDLLGWTTEKLLDTCVGYIASDYDSHHKDEKWEQKEKSRYKKILQRESWISKKARSSTLNGLKELRDTIYLTDDYDKIKTSLSPRLTKEIQLISKSLEKRLKEMP